MYVCVYRPYGILQNLSDDPGLGPVVPALLEAAWVASGSQMAVSIHWGRLKRSSRAPSKGSGNKMRQV